MYQPLLPQTNQKSQSRKLLWFVLGAATLLAFFAFHRSYGLSHEIRDYSSELQVSANGRKERMGDGRVIRADPAHADRFHGYKCDADETSTNMKYNILDDMFIEESNHITAVQFCASQVLEDPECSAVFQLKGTDPSTPDNPYTATKHSGCACVKTTATCSWVEDEDSFVYEALQRCYFKPGDGENIEHYDIENAFSKQCFIGEGLCRSEAPAVPVDDPMKTLAPARLNQRDIYKPAGDGAKRQIRLRCAPTIRGVADFGECDAEGKITVTGCSGDGGKYTNCLDCVMQWKDGIPFEKIVDMKDFFAGTSTWGQAFDANLFNEAATGPCEAVCAAQAKEYRTGYMLGKGATAEVYGLRSRSKDMILKKITIPETSIAVELAYFITEIKVLTYIRSVADNDKAITQHYSLLVDATEAHKQILGNTDGPLEGFAQLKIIYEPRGNHDLTRKKCAGLWSTPSELFEKIFLPVFAMVEALHLVGIVHHDIKDTNLMWKTVDKKINPHEGHPLLVDWGNAGTLEDTQIKGTHHYMAPDHFSEEIITYKVDMWALGVLVYNFVHGKYWFNEDVFDNAHTEFMDNTGPGKKLKEYYSKVKDEQGIEVITPPAEFIHYFKLTQETTNVDNIQKWKSATVIPPGKTWDPKITKKTDKDAISDFLSKLLEFNPKKRMSAGTALAHTMWTTLGIQGKVGEIRAKFAPMRKKGLKTLRSLRKTNFAAHRLPEYLYSEKKSESPESQDSH